jgi:hypothetical protein
LGRRQKSHAFPWSTTKQLFKTKEHGAQDVVGPRSEQMMFQCVYQKIEAATIPTPACHIFLFKSLLSKKQFSWCFFFFLIFIKKLWSDPKNATRA